MPALTPEEAEEVNSWQVPVESEASDGTKLLVSEAERELEVRLPLGGGLECVGHLDMAWTKELQALEKRPLRVAFVADAKKTIWTSTGPETLQVMAYAATYARMRQCDYYTTGIYVAEDGEWHWLDRMIRVGSSEDLGIVGRVTQAALNLATTGSTGLHCRECWERLHCPEHLGEAIKLVADPQGLTCDAATQVLRAKALVELGKAVVEEFEERARRGEAIRDETSGKRFLPVNMPGRKSIDFEALEKAFPEARSFQKTGKPFQQFRWLKEKK
jgi:hypothetical protein